MNQLRLLIGTLLFLVFIPLNAGEIVKPGDRIVFIGDSITGQGGQGDRGWVALIGKALQQVDPANQQVLIPLGGSGQTVGSWGNVEKQSREKSVFLDVKEFDVRKELGQHADIVVMMLGMNDVLSTGLKDSPEAIAKWKSRYADLINRVRERTTPRVLALATPTPCTEDPLSPKNLVMARMVKALKELAREENGIVLPTRETAWEVLAAGRKSNPNFHIVGDQVHPNASGHAVIASGMLKGLGEQAGADLMFQQALARGQADDPGALSYSLNPQHAEVVGDFNRFELTVFHRDAKPRFEIPDGWTIRESEAGTGFTRYELAARLDRERNPLAIHCGGQSRALTLPAPWLVGTGNAGGKGWNSIHFDPESARRAADEVVRLGVGFEDGPPALELKPGVPLSWKTFVGNLNYGGGGDPDVLDFAQLTYFIYGETAYGLRWLHSPLDQEISVEITRPGFAGTGFVELWINGETVYAGDPAKAKGKRLVSRLRQGWNRVSFKSNFAQWQWQLGIGLRQANGDALENLKYSLRPR